ncbi:MAG: hypothetical protein ACR2KJ_09885 [Jatrophihabitans sp.]
MKSTQVHAQQSSRTQVVRRRLMRVACGAAAVVSLALLGSAVNSAGQVDPTDWVGHIAMSTPAR